MKKLTVLLAFMVLGIFSAQAQNNYAPPAGKVVPIADFYEGGKDAMYKFINDNINYPINAKRNRVQGEVVLSVNIGADGKATNQEIVKNVNGGCGEEALRVLKLMKFKGQGYSSRQNLSVYFRL
jgi:periplasmic protein TonB